MEKGGERIAEYGPGAVLGERAGIESGTRNSTLVAVTGCRVAVVAHEQMDKEQAAGAGPRATGQRGLLRFTQARLPSV